MSETAFDCAHCGVKTCRETSNVNRARKLGHRLYCGRECWRLARCLDADTRKKSLAARFDSKVRKSTGCWEWTGSLNTDGYGLLFVGSRHECTQRTALAHRVSWELAHGAIPGTLCVLHRCDNPRCVRPEHLFLGTVADNITDMDSKGRRRNGKQGERNRNSKLTSARVRTIRALHSEGVTGVALAQRYGVTPGSIYHVLNGLTWRCVPLSGETDDRTNQ